MKLEVKASSVITGKDWAQESHTARPTRPGRFIPET